MQDAVSPEIEPPAHVSLEPTDFPFWRDILKSRAKHEWTEADLIHAANLARCMASIESETTMLRQEGSVIENQRGTPIANPRHMVLEQLSRRSMALSRILQMQSVSKGVIDDKLKARERERDARRAAKTLDEDLIPLV